MTLSQIIKLRTNNGRTIVDFLVDVMQDRADDFRMCHRLQAARLLNTYGNEDAPDFIADNSQAPQSDRDKHRPRRPTTFDAELARVIREDTNDGRSIARFLVNVMEGELRTFRPHHRMAAARELLDRGFGKSARAEKVVRPRIKSRAAYDTVEGSKLADEHPLTPHSSRPPVVPAESLPRTRSGAGTQRREGREVLTHHSSTFTPRNNTAVLEGPRQQPESETALRIYIADDTDYWLGIYDSPLYEFFCECVYPDFDPYLAAIDEEYFQSFTDCTGPECEVHGDPSDFDPNDHHY